MGTATGGEAELEPLTPPTTARSPRRQRGGSNVTTVRHRKTTLHSPGTDLPASQRLRHTGHSSATRRHAHRNQFVGMCGGRKRQQRGFSLLELLVVLAITAILTALLFPAFAKIREDAQRVVCSSNQRNIGTGINMYANDHNHRLPTSDYAHEGKPQEMMASHRGGGDPFAWEGLGHLYIMGYCGNNICFHCPSHSNIHTPDRYHQHYNNADGEEPIFTNFHYIGDWDWKQDRFNRLTEGERLPLVTDGLRTAADYNHGEGMNVLRADFSVIWYDDVSGRVRRLVPTDVEPEGHADLEDTYAELWDVFRGSR